MTTWSGWYICTFILSIQPPTISFHFSSFFARFRHEEIAAKAKSSSRNLKEQVQSSENAVVKMRKHGRPAALGFTVLGVIIGLAIGLKAPGLGQVIAVVAGVIIGGFCFGCFALATYLFMCSRARRKEKMWKKAKDDNEVGLGLAKVVEPKRTQLGEIYNVLDDLQEGNYDMTITSIVSEMDEYMKDSNWELIIYNYLEERMFLSNSLSNFFKKITIKTLYIFNTICHG